MTKIWFQREVYLREETEKKLRIAAQRLSGDHQKVSPGELASVAWQMLLAFSSTEIYDSLAAYGFLPAEKRELLPLVAKGLVKQSRGKPLTIVNRGVNTGAYVVARMLWVHVPSYQTLAERAKALFVTKQSLCETAVASLIAMSDDHIQDLYQHYAEVMNKKEVSL